jgi:hypothetical protein
LLFNETLPLDSPDAFTAAGGIKIEAPVDATAAVEDVINFETADRRVTSLEDIMGDGRCRAEAMAGIRNKHVLTIILISLPLLVQSSLLQ